MTHNVNILYYLLPRAAVPPCTIKNKNRLRFAEPVSGRRCLPGILVDHSRKPRKTSSIKDACISDASIFDANISDVLFEVPFIERIL